MLSATGKRAFVAAGREREHAKPYSWLHAQATERCSSVEELATCRHKHKGTHNHMDEIGRCSDLGWQACHNCKHEQLIKNPQAFFFKGSQGEQYKGTKPAACSRQLLSNARHRDLGNMHLPTTAAIGHKISLSVPFR
eukprot:1071812-Pelagomonas_calceolata.AAC.10